MTTWTANEQYSWGAYPLGPVSNSVWEQDFLWDRGQRTLSNFSLTSTPPAIEEEFHKPLPLVPAACLPLRGGCFVPPLSQCRSTIQNL